QAKLTGYLMQEKLAKLQENDQMDSFKNTLNHTAILLPDETMLTPILYSLPVGKTAEFDLKNYVNVTMGLTMDKTPLFYLINNLFLMQDNLKTESTGELWVYHKDIINLLRHPYIQYSKNYSTDYPLIQQNIAQIQKENLIYVAQKELFEWGKNTDFYRILFKSWESNTKIAIQTLHELINALFRLFDPAFNVLENEYLLEFYKILQQLSQEIEKSKAELSLQTFKHFLYEVIRQESVPFTGDPLAPVQIMGLLESRALDFENVIILSCNEGILPKGKLMNSIIPFDIRKEFNLPTHLETDASYAYAFYRLFHTAKNISLIYYTSDAKIAVGGLEKSRFLAQIEAELSGFENITFSEKPVLLSLPDKAQELFKVEKENPLVEKVEKYLQDSGITPSYMNMYLRNPLEFFERKILNLGDPSE
ncbi:MAG: hypothetical protein EAZ97_00105, partial [Bacteroidetes bacterium]